MTPALGRKPQDGMMLGRNHGHAAWPLQEDPPASQAACPIPPLPEQEGLVPESTKARSLGTYLCDIGQAQFLL